MSLEKLSIVQKRKEKGKMLQNLDFDLKRKPSF